MHDLFYNCLGCEIRVRFRDLAIRSRLATAPRIAMTKVQKPRLPKSYTAEQLVFLKGHLPEYERLSTQGVRGDAKKFALARAEDFIARFGLPEDFAGVEEPQPRFREVSKVASAIAREIKDRG